MDDDCKAAGRVRFLGGPIARVHEENHTDSVGICLPVKDGQPLPPGVAVVQRDEQGDGGHVIYRTPKSVDGPAKVSSAQYRSGWDRIFGKEAN